MLIMMTMMITMNIGFHRWRQPRILRQSKDLLRSRISQSKDLPGLQATFQQILMLHLHGLARDMVKSLRGKGYCSVFLWKGLMEK